MAIIIPKSRLARGVKPSLPASLNLNHPLARGLVGTFYFLDVDSTVAKDYSGTENFLAGPTAPTPIINNFGPGFNFGIADQVFQSATNNYPTVGAGGLTIYSRVRSDPLPANNMVVSHHTSGSSGSFYLAVVSSTSLRFMTDTVSENRDIHSVTWAFQEYFSLAAVYDGTNKRIFLDGKQVGSTGSQSGVLSSAADRAVIGDYRLNGGGSGSWEWQGDINDVLIWTRGLLDSEIAEIDNDPYLLLRPPEKFWFIPEQVTGGNTVLLPKAQINVAGQELTVQATENRFTVLPKGQINTTGQVPTINDGEVFVSQLPKGQINVTGQAPQSVTTENRFSNLPKGQVNVTGQTPQAVTTEDHFSTLAKGQINVTGQALTVDDGAVGGNNIANIPKGQINVTGQAPQSVTTENRFSNLAKGQVNVTGQVPTVVAGENKFAVLPKGQVNVTGQELTVSTTENRFSALPKGQINVIGQTPQVLATENHQIILPRGLINVGAQTLSINDGADSSEVALPKGQINITGFNPTISVAPAWSPIPDESGTWVAIAKQTGTWKPT